MTTYGGYRRDTETVSIERRSSVAGGAQHAAGQYECRAPNWILVVQIGENADGAKVFEADAAPWGLCDNLVNALKLLANQQKDGDSPIQSILTGPRRFIEADNHSAVDVGGLCRGTKSVSVKKPQFSEAFPEAVIRQGADESTLRADEVGTQLAFIDTEHIEFERIGMLSAKQSTKELGWKNGKSCIVTTEIGAKKPSESQKAKGFWAMQAAWDGCGILGRTKTRLELWEEHLEDPIVALAKALGCLENPFEGEHLVSQFVVANLCRRNGMQHRWREDLTKDVRSSLLGRRLALPGSMGRCAFGHIIQLLGMSEKYEPHSGRLLLIRRSRWQLG